MRLQHNCVSTIPDSGATVHLVAEMKIIFSFPWCLETVHWTLVTKHSDGATTSDQWQFALSWPVARQSPPGVKGALDRLAETGVGCHMGIRCIGALALADDLNLLSLTLSGLKVLVDVCEKYAEEYNISLKCSKSRLFIFNGRQCKVSNRGIIVNGVLLNMSESAVHLGHDVCTNDIDRIVTVAKAIFWR